MGSWSRLLPEDLVGLGLNLLQRLIDRDVGRLEWDGEVFLESDQDADLWFFAPAPAGVTRRGELWFKASRPGAITVLRDGAPKGASVRAALSGGTDLASITALRRDGRIVLKPEPWYCGFWIHLEQGEGGAG